MSNGRQIGTLVGSLVAAYFTAGTSYAAFAVAAGGAAGGYLGGLADGPTKVQGARLDDLRVQISSYGVGIPRLYGTERISPNVIWSTDKIEESETTSEGGKGGEEVETTSYRYHVNMRLLGCETPRDGSIISIVKIFSDGKLIWDASSGAPVGSALASEESPAATFTLYQGHQDQLADPEEEAFNGGPGSVPAYRGVVSIYMRRIGCPQGRVPQFSFVMSNGAVIGEENLLYANVPFVDRLSGLYAYGVVRSDMTWHFGEMGFDYDGDYRLVVYNVGSGYATYQREIPSQGVHYGLNPCPVSGDGPPIVLRMRRPAGGSTTSLHTIERYDLSTGALGAVKIYNPIDGSDVLNPESAGYCEATETYAIRGGLSAGDRTSRITLIGPGGEVLSDLIPGSVGPVTIKDHAAYALSVVSGNLVLSMFNSASGTLEASTTGPAYVDGGSSLSWAALHPTDGGVFVWLRNLPNYQLFFVSNILSGGTWDLLSNNANTTGTEKIGSCATTIYATRNLLIIGPSSATDNIHHYNVLRMNVVDAAPPRAKDIIAAECECASEYRYDVSALPDTDTVVGYKIASPASARSNIDPMLSCFGYFPVDEDGLIKFKPYSAVTSVATISYDELGQSEGGDNTDLMPLVRSQEIDLPRSVTVSYIEPTKDYQTASETETRQVTSATEDVQIQLPVCVDSSRGKRVAQLALYDQWRRQNKRSTKVSRKYAFVSPGDGVTIEYPRGTLKLWLVVSTNDTGVLCEWSLVPGDSALFTQTAVGATGYSGQQVAPLAAPLLAQPLDIPLLRDVDNNAGLYVAMDSYAPVPAVGELLVGASESLLESVGTVSQSAPIGNAETVLGAWSRNLVDETNVFTVNIGDDDFVSCTRDVLLSGGGEVWAYGAPGRWEIGSSAVGDSLGGGRYILSRHLRGLFGTEQYTGAHAAGDKFVMLRPAGLLRPNVGVGAIGQELIYKPVAKGRSLNTAASLAYTNTGEGLRPLSPINARRSTSSNDITLTVDRRSRLAMNNSTGALPLGEATESFTWAFYTDGSFAALAGTLLSNSSSVTINSAQQTAFGLTPGATVYFRVAQNSDSVGLGHELEAIL